MAKKGPCFHCGVDSSPLWRKGPAHKPVLCNACGMHYNLKGNLQTYLPKSLRIHSQNNKSKKAAPKDFWNNIPRRKRSVVVSKPMTPMEIFQRQLLSLYRWQSQTPNESFPEEENVLVDNTNNFIGTNEIGLGAVLLKADPGPSFPCSSSADNQAQPHSSTIEP